VDFFLSQNNLLILVIALTSGFMLLLPTLMKGRSGGTVSSQQAVQLVNQQQGIFLDVRSADLFKTGSIPQARNVPAADIESRLNSLPKNKPIIVVCDQGRESARVAGILRKQGFEQAVSLSGGLRAWVQDGLPLAKKS
jgi:rhodanese-related sulfurtransferase